MKKILFTLVAFLCLPFIVSAKVNDVNYNIKAMYVNADILDNGDMHVRELIVLKGSFNGYERELYLNNAKLNTNKKVNYEHDAIYNPKDVTLVKTSAEKMSDYSFSDVKSSYDAFKQVNRDAVGSNDVYYEKKDNHQLVVRTNKSCSSCQVGFYYEYIVSSAVVMHKDVAELYYEFIGNAFTDEIAKVDIRVNLPGKDKSDDFHIWAHGNLQGTIDYNDNKSGAIIEVEKLKAKNTVDVRMTFDKNLIKDDSSLNYNNEEALPSILEIEKKRADEANKERQRIKRIYYGFQYAALIYLGLLIAYFLYILIKYDREYETDFDHQYNREFIDDYDVEVIDYLMNRNISANAMSASIMNLIYKKKIKATEADKKDYSLELLSRDGLSNAETKLVEFLFDTVAGGDVLTLNALKKYAKSERTYSKFTSSYQKWKNVVTANGIKENFYEDNTSARIKAALFGVLGIIISIASMVIIEDFAWSHLTLIPAIAFIIYVFVFKKKTLKGINHYKRWKAFKNFLNDFGSFEDKELPEVALWERYLVYAVIFGLANKVQKAMNVKIKQMEELGYNTTLFDIHYFNTQLNMSHVINSSVSTAISNSVSAAAAHSISASGSGHGGGFSSGGGFGGGGGGGHGF